MKTFVVTDATGHAMKLDADAMEKEGDWIVFIEHDEVTAYFYQPHSVWIDGGEQ